MRMNYEVYRELLSMLDMEEACKGNPLHIEIFNRIGDELSKDSNWENPNEPETYDEMAVDLLLVLGKEDEVPKRLQYLIPKFEPMYMEVQSRNFHRVKDILLNESEDKVPSHLAHHIEKVKRKYNIQ